MKLLSPRLPNSRNPSSSGDVVVLIVVAKRRITTNFCGFNERERVKPDSISKKT